MDTGPNLGLLTIRQAIFLHSPDCEFAEVGAKSEIPYKHWFNLFKEFLMKNVTNSNTQVLFAWWNGLVFSIDSTKSQGVKADDVESGMDEADLFLADSDDNFLDSETISRRENNNNEEDFIGTFNNLTIDMQDSTHQPLLSHAVTVTDPCGSSSNSQLDSIEPIILQPDSDKSVSQKTARKLKLPSTQKGGVNGKAKRNLKGKQKAAFSDDTHLEVEELVETEGLCTANERNLRSRRK
jgi:hypothetical protein